MKRMWLVLAATLALGLLRGTTANGQEGGDLIGTQWRLLSYGAPTAPTPVIGEGPLTLEFGAEGKLSGSGGCNGYGGKYAVSGQTLTISEIISTLMACLDDDATIQEATYFQALQTATRYERSQLGEQLTILYGEGQQMTFARITPLSNSQWRLVSYGAPGAETPSVNQPLTNREVTLAFRDDTTFSGFAGCNSFSGEYVARGDTISFPDITYTFIGCLDMATSAQERAYLALLDTALSYALSDDKLTILSKNGQRLNFVRTLTNSSWQLSSFGAAGTETPVMSASSVVTLEFKGTNEVAGSGGCNTYSGTYTAKDNEIMFSQITSTEKACLDDAVMKQERAYFDALQAARTYKLSGDALIITYGDNRQLTFMRAVGPPASK
jgi:heat shock protein HslJ